MSCSLNGESRLYSMMTMVVSARHLRSVSCVVPLLVACGGVRRTQIDGPMRLSELHGTIYVWEAMAIAHERNQYIV